MKFNFSLLIVLTFNLFLNACARPPGGEITTPTVTSIVSDPATVIPKTTTTNVAFRYQKDQAGTFFAINEVGLGPDGYVALTNFTGVPVSLEGLYLCQGDHCYLLPDEVVAGGDTVRIAAGDGKGLESVIATEVTYGELEPANGEIALLKSEQTDDPKAMLVYLQWGSSPHQLTDTAVKAGLWVDTSFAPSSPNATRLYRVEESGLWLFEEQ
jgi:hypothetical protein